MASRRESARYQAAELVVSSCSLTSKSCEQKLQGSLCHLAAIQVRVTSKKQGVLNQVCALRHIPPTQYAHTRTRTHTHTHSVHLRPCVAVAAASASWWEAAVLGPARPQLLHSVKSLHMSNVGQNHTYTVYVR
jgi:hypothetical protein